MSVSASNVTTTVANLTGSAQAPAQAPAHAVTRPAVTPVGASRPVHADRISASAHEAHQNAAKFSQDFLGALAGTPPASPGARPVPAALTSAAASAAAFLGSSPSVATAAQWSPSGTKPATTTTTTPARALATAGTRAIATTLNNTHFPPAAQAPLAPLPPRPTTTTTTTTTAPSTTTAPASTLVANATNTSLAAPLVANFNILAAPPSVCTTGRGTNIGAATTAAAAPGSATASVAAHAVAQSVLTTAPTPSGQSGLSVSSAAAAAAVAAATAAASAARQLAGGIPHRTRLVADDEDGANRPGPADRACSTCHNRVATLTTNDTNPTCAECHYEIMKLQNTGPESNGSSSSAAASTAPFDHAAQQLQYHQSQQQQQQQAAYHHDYMQQMVAQQQQQQFYMYQQHQQQQQQHHQQYHQPPHHYGGAAAASGAQPAGYYYYDPAIAAAAASAASASSGAAAAAAAGGEYSLMPLDRRTSLILRFQLPFTNAVMQAPIRPLVMDIMLGPKNASFDKTATSKNYTKFRLQLNIFVQPYEKELVPINAGKNSNGARTEIRLDASDSVPLLWKEPLLPNRTTNPTNPANPNSSATAAAANPSSAPAAAAAASEAAAVVDAPIAVNRIPRASALAANAALDRYRTGASAGGADGAADIKSASAYSAAAATASVATATATAAAPAEGKKGKKKGKRKGGANSDQEDEDGDRASSSSAAAAAAGGADSGLDEGKKKGRKKQKSKLDKAAAASAAAGGTGAGAANASTSVTSENLRPAPPGVLKLYPTYSKMIPSYSFENTELGLNIESIVLRPSLKTVDGVPVQIPKTPMIWVPKKPGKKRREDLSYVKLREGLRLSNSSGGGGGGGDKAKEDVIRQDLGFTYELVFTFEAGSRIVELIGNPSAADTSQNWRPHIRFFTVKIQNNEPAPNNIFEITHNEAHRIFTTVWGEEEDYVEPHVQPPPADY